MREMTAIGIFAVTYLVMATGRLPGFRLDRTGAALLGGALMVAAGVLSLDQAYRAIDWDTITLLLGMMIVVANLRLSGCFGVLTEWLANHVRRPLGLLVLVLAVSGLCSAFLVNDTICLVLTPLVLDLTLRLRRDPVPYLLALAMASNMGSVATITGNPQNVMIGSFSHIAYGRFAAVLTPVALAGLAIAGGLIVLGYRRELLGERLIVPAPMARPFHRGLALKTIAVTATMLIGFFVIAPPAKPALVAGALLLLTRALKPRRIYREIDWGLLVMFAGLFVVIAGLQRAVLTPDLIQRAAAWPLDRVPVMTGVAAVLSNLVSNVPAVMVLRPFVETLARPEPAWLTLAMASTLAGNLTILGSVANLIVVQRARERGVTIGFWTYFRMGAPVTVLSLLAGMAILNR